MLAIVELHYDTCGKKIKKTMIINNIKILHICVGRGHITLCTESYCIIGDGREGVRESNREV
jgi:hypothetical protein